MTDPASRYCLSSGCYDELTKKDRNTVRGPVTALAEICPGCAANSV